MQKQKKNQIQPTIVNNEAFRRHQSKRKNQSFENPKRDDNQVLYLDLVAQLNPRNQGGPGA